ncbi:MAG: hypothetical protein GC147_14790 [Porphyrobacter sp.]|nr:hypothetical protein [Porphyrobacter sp.]
MKRVVLLAPLFAGVLGLAACEDKPAAPPAEQGGEAAGEVLGGSISDAMIPLEQLESEAPLLPRQSATSGPAAEEDAAADSEAAPDSEGAEKAPAAPAPEPAAPAAAE